MRHAVWFSLWWFCWPAAVLAGAPVQQAPCGFQIPQRGRSSLFMVTHGWNANIAWVQGMERRIDNRAPGEWDARSFDWRDQAGTIFSSDPADALYPAFHLGQCLGAQIAERGYERVHLVGHSAGSELMAAAVELIKQRQPDTRVHLTLLDPYTPGLNGLWQGQSANWVDQYFVEDGIAFAFPYLRWTDHALPSAHAVDISSFDPVFEVGHIWVHDWYADTITQQRPVDAGYGWPLTMEVQGATWASPRQYSRGTTVVLGNVDDAASVRQPAVLRRQALGSFTDLQIAEQSAAGVTVVKDVLALESAGEAIWVRLFVDFTEDMNALTFTSLLTSGTSGVAAAYFDNQPVRAWEAAHATGQPARHIVYLKDQDEGRHELTFRLDGTASALRVTGVSFANVDLRLPGDATGDGAFDSADLVQVFQRGKYEDGISSNAIFLDGDWNSDGEFDSGDLVSVFRFGTYRAAGAATPVPEPPLVSTTAALFLVAALLLSCRRR